MSAATVYNYFGSKHELLFAVLSRGNAWLQISLEDIFAATDDPIAALDKIVSSYLNFAFTRGSRIAILMQTLHALPTEMRNKITALQRDYVSEWVRLLQLVRPDLTTGYGQAVVQTVIIAINDLTRTPSLMRQANFLRDTLAVSRNVLFTG